ncbi:MAG TPA: endolytic transglycosylase MltG [Candidatus Limiplasma sp.]|mgnify:CR=1 FL=1|nr:endolytic transglycosylase MltG [Candidatus Limiplasma sp.]HPS81938.1 endolytic transglycosylase MltG [Candidatus Limiplasma sp.]
MAKHRRDYDHESLRDERQYGFYWYSGLWNVIRPILIVLTALVLVFGLASGIYQQIEEKYISAVAPDDTAQIPFSVENGQSLTRVANNLMSAGIIKNQSVFKYYCDFAGLGQKIQAGDYQLSKSMNIFQIAEKLTTGDGKPMTTTITVIPGWTVEDIAAMLVEKGVFKTTDAFLQLCRSGEGLSDYYFIQDELKTARVSERKYLLEGYLAPNTYEIYTNASPTDILKKLLDQTDSVLSVEWQERASDIGLSVDQVLTLASLIEKEAKTADFAKVSAVFQNRLKNNMNLGSDVTIHYITGERRMALRDSDLAIDSPYNTYKYAGLPLGPICNPSSNAIQAALYPDESFIAEKYLYFCSKDPNTGELVFSKTLEEHNAAVAIYAPLWKQYDQERGIQ